tara:strand:- start:82 stop:870 length:789 start_codon:yes stop_codon:yes gene_type:complete
MKKSFILFILISGLVFAQKYNPLTGEEIKIEKVDPFTGEVIKEKELESKKSINDGSDANSYVEDSVNQLSAVISIPQSMIGDLIILRFINDIELFGRITAQNRNYITLDIKNVGEAIIPLKNIKSFNLANKNNTSYGMSSKSPKGENYNNKIDILDFERSIEAEFSQYMEKKNYLFLGVGGCALAPLTFGLSIPLVAIYGNIPVKKTEPTSKFYRDLPSQYKIRYKTEFNKKITAKKASDTTNGMIGSVILFTIFMFLVELG